MLRIIFQTSCDCARTVTFPLISQLHIVKREVVIETNEDRCIRGVGSVWVQVNVGMRDQGCRKVSRATIRWAAFHSEYAELRRSGHQKG